MTDNTAGCVKWPGVFDEKIKTCMLIITHECNLNCSYCYEEHKDQSAMEFTMAREIILAEIESVMNGSEFDKLMIEFIGGEPLVNFNLIKQIVEWLENEPPDIPFLCFASTNGTLLDETRKEWFKKHRKTIWLGASYDGSPGLQKTNRGIKDEIDLDFFIDNWPLQALHMTLSKESLSNFSSGLISLLEKGHTAECAIAQGIDWNVDDAVCYRDELRKVAEWCLNNRTIIPPNVLTRNLNGVTHGDEKIRQRKFCGTGSHMSTYDTDGKIYGCHMFSPVVLGRERAFGITETDWKNSDISEDSRCIQCVLKNTCPTCMGFNLKYRNNLAKRDMRWCSMILAESMVACEFQIRLLASEKQISGVEDAKYASGAISAYEILSEFELADSVAPFYFQRKRKEVRK